MDSSALLEWLSRNRETLTLIGGGIAATASGAWVVLRYALDRNAKGNDAKRGGRSSGGAAGTSGIHVGTAHNVHIIGSNNNQQNWFQTSVVWAVVVMSGAVVVLATHRWGDAKSARPALTGTAAATLEPLINGGQNEGDPGSSNTGLRVTQDGVTYEVYPNGRRRY